MLAVIRGLPGTGKTTLAKIIKTHRLMPDSVYHINNDMVRDAYYTGVPIDDVDWQDVRSIVNRCIEDAVVSGRDILIDGVYSQPWMIDRLLSCSGGLSACVITCVAHGGLGTPRYVQLARSSVNGATPESVRKAMRAWEPIDGEIVIKRHLSDDWPPHVIDDVAYRIAEHFSGQ